MGIDCMDQAQEHIARGQVAATVAVADAVSSGPCCWRWQSVELVVDHQTCVKSNTYLGERGSCWSDKGRDYTDMTRARCCYMM